MVQKSKEFLIGWEHTDITPEDPVCLCGQFHARVSENVKDPITATVCVFDSIKEGRISDHAVMISCDLVAIPEEFKKSILAKTHILIPEIDLTKIIVNATHTHTAPEVGGDVIRGTNGSNIKEMYGVDLPCMDVQQYIDFASGKIVEALRNAWEKRSPGGISYGLGFAVVGHNRRASYYDGSSVMYGKTNTENFSHIEGYEDHSINLLTTTDKMGNLTGMIVNIACPSQVDEHLFSVSADYWHETRQQLKKKFGDIFVMPQCSAAGDQSPHILIGQQAQQRMWNLAGRNQREEIAVRISDGIEKILPLIRKETNTLPDFTCVQKEIDLSANTITEDEISIFMVEAEKHYKEYEKLKSQIEANPEKTKQPRWYKDITFHFKRYKWYKAVKDRFEAQKQNPKVKVNIHVMRIGDVIMATNPFECYLDYGMRIKARSRAIQTFIVQLAGGGTYLPTERAKKSGSYGAISPSCIVGPEGGRELVESTLKIINSLI